MLHIEHDNQAAGNAHSEACNVNYAVDSAAKQVSDGDLEEVFNHDAGIVKRLNQRHARTEHALAQSFPQQ